MLNIPPMRVYISRLGTRRVEWVSGSVSPPSFHRGYSPERIDLDTFPPRIQIVLELRLLHLLTRWGSSSKSEAVFRNSPGLRRLHMFSFLSSDAGTRHQREREGEVEAETRPLG